MESSSLAKEHFTLVLGQNGPAWIVGTIVLLNNKNKSMARNSSYAK
jgi:hypothetical protein